MITRFVCLTCCLGITLTSCKKRDAASEPNDTTSASSPVNIDPCALLKNEEVEAIQGSPIKETKTSQTPSGSNLQTVQCFYVATEFSKSVSLSLTRAAPQSSTKTVVTEFWKERFANPQKRDEQEREADREKKESLREQHREQEEKEGSALQKIEGIGDDAYWSGTRVGGALYVLKNQAFLRISLGGADSNEARIEKTRELAAKALQRL